MGKLSREELNRRDGIQWALRIVHEGGVEALERECEIRRISDVPVGLRERELNQFCNNVRANAVDTICIIALATLEDEFDFTREQCNRFKERFNLKTDCLVDGYATWDDIKQQLQDDMDMKLEIRENSQSVTIKG